MVRSKTSERSAWWSESRWPEPGVLMISTSRPSSLKNPSSPATSKGRSWMAFIIDALTFLSDAVMARLQLETVIFCHFLLQRMYCARGNRRREQALRGGRSSRRARTRRENRSEEHTSELQSLAYLVCRLLLEKKKKKDYEV